MSEKQIRKEYKLYQLNIFAERPKPPESAEPTSVVTADFYEHSESIAAYSKYWAYLGLLRCNQKDSVPQLLAELSKLVLDLEPFRQIELSPYKHHSATLVCGDEVIKTFLTDLALEE
jgi:hypothetical protein